MYVMKLKWNVGTLCWIPLDTRWHTWNSTSSFSASAILCTSISATPKKIYFNSSLFFNILSIYCSIILLNILVVYLGINYVFCFCFFFFFFFCSHFMFYDYESPWQSTCLLQMTCICHSVILYVLLRTSYVYIWCGVDAGIAGNCLFIWGTDSTLRGLLSTSGALNMLGALVCYWNINTAWRHLKGFYIITALQQGPVASYTVQPSGLPRDGIYRAAP